jgi:Tol biopolymer transport system component
MGTPTPRRHAAAVVAAALVCALGWAAPASAQAPLWPWELVSRGGPGSDPQTGYSPLGRLSADGRHVAFESTGTELHPAHDSRSIYDVYLKDMDTGDLRLVSRAGLAGPGGDDVSHLGGISADARYAGFGSFAKNLHAEDPDRWYDSFVKDMRTGAIRLVSPSPAEGRGDGYGGTSPAVVSADGRYATFHVIDFADGPRGVYRRDLVTGELELVSQPTGTSWKRSGHAGSPVISDDGRYVTFPTTEALVPEDRDTEGIDVYQRDLEQDVTTLVSTPDLVGHAQSPTSSADGGRVAYVRQPTGGTTHAYVWDRSTGETQVGDRVLLTDVLGGDHVDWARISPDGSRLVYMSFATNLGLDLDEYSDVFVRNLETGLTENVSFLLPGPGRWHSGNGDISPDNEFVVFGSGDQYLSLENSDSAGADVYRRRLLQFPPLCVPTARTVERDTSASVALPCRDLEGDDMELEIVRQPEHGTLGPVNSERGTVEHTPAPGYTGADSFEFRAADSGGSGNTAIAALVVHPPVVAGGGPPPSAVPPPTSADAPPFAVPDLGAPPPRPAAHGPAQPPGITPAAAPCAIPLTGTSSADLLVGGAAGELLRGSAGNDRLRAAGGDDCLEGGAGRDAMAGGAGDDSLRGGAGGDSLAGDGGDDALEGGPGRDVHRGGAGADRIQAADGVRERVDCGRGRDRATVDRFDVVSGCERVKRRRAG